jgi:hypothetical protein
MVRQALEIDGVPTAERHSQELPQSWNLGVDRAIFPCAIVWSTGLHSLCCGHILCERAAALLGVVECEVKASYCVQSAKILCKYNIQQCHMERP